jgi:hypothetical protein
MWSRWRAWVEDKYVEAFVKDCGKKTELCILERRMEDNIKVYFINYRV